MTARILHFPSKRSNKMKKIDPELLKLMMKHHLLIRHARRRGYSKRAIVKLVRAAEESLR